LVSSAQPSTRSWLASEASEILGAKNIMKKIVRELLPGDVVIHSSGSLHFVIANFKDPTREYSTIWFIDQNKVKNLFQLFYWERSVA
jgi:hypothetical protein